MPSQHHIHIKEDGKEAKVDMQVLLDHQCKRLLTLEDIQKMEKIKQNDPLVKFLLYFKYGADGSSSHSDMQFRG